jgi:hypothetical protein
MEEGRGVYRVLVGKPDGKIPLRRPRCRWDDNINPLTPNGHYSGHTAPLISRRCILNIYSTNIVLNILNMLHNLRFSLFKMPFIS